MNKTKNIQPVKEFPVSFHFRMSELDFQYLRKQAEREHLKVSQVLRRIINWHKERRASN